MHHQQSNLFFFFFNDTAPTEIYTLSLHDALPISSSVSVFQNCSISTCPQAIGAAPCRSEEHTSELQSRGHLVCRLLLEKKNATKKKLRILFTHTTSIILWTITKTRTVCIARLLSL